jgi:hypothetical protein
MSCLSMARSPRIFGATEWPILQQERYDLTIAETLDGV